MSEIENGEDIGIEVEADVVIDDLPQDAPQRAHSWTRINTFQTCPHQYWQVYMAHKKGEANSPMVIGRVCHQAIGLYNQHCIKNNIEHDFDKWKDIAWRAIGESNIEAGLNEDVLKLVEQYAQSHTVNLESVVGAEEEIAINKDRKQVDWLSPDVWMRVIIDYLQISGNVAKITDYKTGWAMRSDPFQLMIYAWVVKQLYPHVTDFQIEIDYIRHEFQSSTTFTEEDMENIERAILTKTARIEAETKFEPCVGIQCSYCPVWYACTAMKDMPDFRRFTVPKSAEEAVDLALNVEKYMRMASEAKKVLKEYCDLKGELVAGGRLFKFNASTRYDFDMNEMVIELDNMGINLLDYVAVDMRKFKPLMRDERVDKLIKAKGKRKVSVSFTSKRAGKDGDKSE